MPIKIQAKQGGSKGYSNKPMLKAQAKANKKGKSSSIAYRKKGGKAKK